MPKKPKEISKKDWDSVESPPLSNDILSRMAPVRRNHPEIPAKVRAPQKTGRKLAVSIRLSPEVINYFKSKGEDWQTKIEEVILDYVKSQRSL